VVVLKDGHSRALYLYSRARLAGLNGDVQSAQQALREALAMEPDSAFLHCAMGETKMKAGQVQEELEHINKAIKLDPSTVNPMLLRCADGNCRQGQGSGGLPEKGRQAEAEQG
jgi:predicted Zn-dependent protease